MEATGFLDWRKPILQAEQALPGGQVKASGSASLLPKQATVHGARRIRTADLLGAI